MADVTMRIWRGDSTGGDFENYTISQNEGEVVLDVIHRIQARLGLRGLPLLRAQQQPQRQRRLEPQGRDGLFHVHRATAPAVPAAPRAPGGWPDWWDRRHRPLRAGRVPPRLAWRLPGPYSPSAPLS